MSLILIPTPLQDDHPLEPVALKLLMTNALDEKYIILVEEHKVARNRWIKWGLPREGIEKFILYNEHTQLDLIPELVKKMKQGFWLILMSDCGLPAFCDPGQKLVDACHRSKIKVTSTPFANSISLAVSLSGFESKNFEFSGFVPHKSPDREMWMKSQLKKNQMQIWMDTPYRLKKLAEELIEQKCDRELFFGINLGAENELLLRGTIAHLKDKLQSLEKAEFVLLIASR